jgi:glycine/D-amino acid oxidase-like deaminating enzyme
MVTETVRVAVVGGGFGGRCAALVLQESHAVEVTLHEAKRSPGTPPNTVGGIAWHWTPVPSRTSPEGASRGPPGGCGRGLPPHGA